MLLELQVGTKQLFILIYVHNVATYLCSKCDIASDNYLGMQYSAGNLVHKTSMTFNFPQTMYANASVNMQ